MELGKKIKQLRKFSGMTQEQLAEKLNYSSHYFSNYNWKKVIKLPVNTML